MSGRTSRTVSVIGPNQESPWGTARPVNEPVSSFASDGQREALLLPGEGAQHFRTATSMTDQHLETFLARKAS